jgi:hypothetical protein
MRKLLLVFLACIGLVSVATAGPIFTFTDVLNTGLGTLSYDGTTASISNMPAVLLTVLGAPVNDGAYLIDGIGGFYPPGPGGCVNLAPVGCGVINSTTGAQTGTGAGFASFGPGGSLTLSGSLDCGPGNVTCGALGTQVLTYQGIILSGSYSNATLNFASATLALSGVGGDIKSAPFLEYFGLPGPTLFSFSLTANAAPGQTSITPFTSALTGGNVTNVAEPSGLFLLGTGLLVGAGLLRRKLLR